MSDVYASKRRRVARLIKRWNSGVVTLTKAATTGAVAATPWIPGEPALTVYQLDARVDGVADEYIDGTLVAATDLMIIASPKALNVDTGEIVDIYPAIDDGIQIDEVDKVIKKIEAVPVSGSPARFHIFVKS